jgi:hypothetical protein
MKTPVKPGKQNPAKKSNKKQGNNTNNPKKPGNDPDQTPNREVEQVPVAKPDSNGKGK